MGLSIDVRNYANRSFESRNSSYQSLRTPKCPTNASGTELGESFELPEH